MSEIRYKDLGIYYGCNNYKSGPVKYDKKGNPKLKMNVAGDWFVYYQFWDSENNKFVRVKERRGLNEYKVLEEKLQAAENLKAVIKEELDQGYNPIKKIYEDISVSADPLDKYKKMSLSDALDYGLGEACKKVKSPITKSGYKSHIGKWKESFSDLGYNFTIAELKTGHIYEGWDHIREIRKRKGLPPDKDRTHIHRRTALLSTLNVFKRKEVFVHNPAEGMELPKIPKKGNRFAPFTPEEVYRIGRYAKRYDFTFYVYLKLIYQTTFRPIEILRLRASDFRPTSGFMRISSDDSKTEEDAFVPLSPDLIEDLVKLGIKDTEPDNYIFSDIHTLKTGPKQLIYGHISARFRKLRKKLKLSDDKKMYALKHTGGDARMAAINEPVPENLSVEEMLRMILEIHTYKSEQDKLTAVKNLMRHNNESTTKLYLTETNNPLNEYLKKNSPKF